MVDIKNPVLKQIWEDRYKKGEEDLKGNLKRVAKFISNNEKEEENFFNIMYMGGFFPAGRTMSNSGVGRNLTLNNCFLKNTLVLTENGLKEIQNIKEGEKVLTKNGNYETVLKCIKNPNNKKLVKITTTYGCGNLICTSDHNIFTNHGWKKAEDLIQKGSKRDMLAILKQKENKNENFIIDISNYLKDIEDKIEITDTQIIGVEKKINLANGGYGKTKTIEPINRFITCDKKFAYLIGRWIGDGCISTNPQKDFSEWLITFNSKTENENAELCKKYFEEIFNISIKLYTDEKQHTTIIRKGNISIGTFFKNFIGHGVNNKRIPEVFKKSNNEVKLYLLLGLLDSDGMVDSKGAIIFTSINKNLINEIRDICYSINLPCITKYNQKNSYIKKNGDYAYFNQLRFSPYISNYIKPFMSKKYNDNRMSIKENVNNSTLEEDKNFFYTQIKNIEEYECNDEYVYDLSIENEHSYIANGIVVHNCFVAPTIQDSLDDIFKKVSLGAQTHQKGGGIGYNFSQLRPKGSPTSNEAIASGPVSFMDVFNAQTATILQGNRRGM